MRLASWINGVWQRCKFPLIPTLNGKFLNLIFFLNGNICTLVAQTFNKKCWWQLHQLDFYRQLNYEVKAQIRNLMLSTNFFDINI